MGGTSWPIDTKTVRRTSMADRYPVSKHGVCCVLNAGLNIDIIDIQSTHREQDVCSVAKHHALLSMFRARRQYYHDLILVLWALSTMIGSSICHSPTLNHSNLHGNLLSLIIIITQKIICYFLPKQMALKALMPPVANWESTNTSILFPTIYIRSFSCLFFLPLSVVLYLLLSDFSFSGLFCFI